jgi:hypothetical protein
LVEGIRHRYEYQKNPMKLEALEYQ